MFENRRRETLIVRRKGFRWALVAAYLSMAVILTVTLSGIAFDGSGMKKITAWRTIR